MGVGAEVKSAKLSLFVDIAAQDARVPFAAGRVFADDMVRVNLEEFQRLCRLAIFVALGVFCARRVSEDGCKASLMRFVHLVMLGFAHAVMLGGRRGGEGGGSKCY